MPWQDNKVVMHVKTTMLGSSPPLGLVFLLARFGLNGLRTINRAPGAKPLFLRES